MYIIYNNDGSVKRTNFAEFIQKGNDNVNSIFVGNVSNDIQDYNVYATFVLPNGELGGPVLGVESSKEINGVVYNGYSIPITAEMTQYAGVIKVSLYVADENSILYTYPVNLTINDATSSPDLTRINITQYQQLLNALNGGIPFTRETPTQDHENGIAIAILSEEPLVKYNGWLYVIE